MNTQRIFRFATRFLIMLGLLSLFPKRSMGEFDGDIRLWQTVGLNAFENDDWRVSLAAQSRLFDEGQFLGAWLIFPTVEYKLHPNLDIGATYLLEDIRAEAGTDYTRLHIFWLNASPHWQLSENLKFSMRHVIGLRAVESKDDYWISRHRFDFDYKLQNFGRLMGIGIGTELFYNYEKHRLFENRFIPLKATFKLTNKAKLSLYVMAQSKRYAGRSDWETAYVLGQTVSYKW